MADLELLAGDLHDQFGKPVDGDHLIQHIDFAFTGVVPGSVTDSLGTGPTAGLFLVCYLGSGVKVELPSGADTVIVTPFLSAPTQILPVGLPVTVTP